MHFHFSMFCHICLTQVISCRHIFVFKPAFKEEVLLCVSKYAVLSVIPAMIVTISFYVVVYDNLCGSCFSFPQRWLECPAASRGAFPLPWGVQMITCSQMEPSWSGDSQLRSQGADSLVFKSHPPPWLYVYTRAWVKNSQLPFKVAVKVCVRVHAKGQGFDKNRTERQFKKLSCKL